MRLARPASHASLAALPLVALLAGCPIWGEDEGFACADGDCSDALPPCDEPADCGTNETCGEDATCHPGSCGYWGCVDGFSCVVAPEGATCQAEPGAGGGGSGGAAASGGAGQGGGAPAETHCGNPADCGAGETCAPSGLCTAGDCSALGCIFGFVCSLVDDAPACVPQSPAACGEDADCAALDDHACIDGACTPPAELCFDGVQCAGDAVCAAGKCTAACTGDLDCPAAYLCDADLGACTLPAESCALTSDCASALEVCVAGACVPRADAGLCEDGLVWVENGCVPSQAATFECTADGTQDTCAAGSICLQGSCFVSCDAPAEDACDALATDVCRSVVTPSGTYGACGTDENLGAECDPTAGLGCGAGEVCVDGFCR